MIKKLDRRHILLINLAVSVVGGSIVILSINLATSVWRILLEAVGTSLIATGLVNFVDKLFVEAQESNSIEIVSMRRARPNRTIYGLKYTAQKIDILGVSLADVLKEFTRDTKREIIDCILKQSTRLRLLLIHPDSKFLIQRASEDHVTWDELRERQLKSIEMVVRLYKMLLDEYQQEERSGSLRTRNVGSLEVDLIDACPYISLFRADNDIYWGLYTSHKTGEETPLFYTKKTDKEGMFESLKDHFYGLLPRESADNAFLVKMIIKDQPPLLNLALVNKLLGPQKVNEILQ